MAGWGTFNPWKARDNKKRSQVSVLTEKYVRECPGCGLMRRMNADAEQCGVCAVADQDYKFETSERYSEQDVARFRPHEPFGD